MTPRMASDVSQRVCHVLNAIAKTMLPKYYVDFILRLELVSDIADWSMG